MLTFGSLFAGIGGFDLGFERAGMECKWQVEIDPYCQRVLAKHWPNVKRYGDIKQLTGYELEPVDVLCGGFPCQPHSLDGKRLASADERDLWGDFARIIRVVRPKWVVAENVPGLLSSEAGRFFGRVLRDLAASGYDAEWDMLPAAAFGAPHIRERVILVAYPGSTRGRTEIESISERTEATHRSCALAYSASDGRGWVMPIGEGNGRTVFDGSGKNVTDAARMGLEGTVSAWDSCSNGCLTESGPGRWETDWWAVEPELGRVADGIPARVDRLRGLGNAIVPQVAEWVGRRIVELEGLTR